MHSKPGAEILDGDVFGEIQSLVAGRILRSKRLAHLQRIALSSVHIQAGHDQEAAAIIASYCRTDIQALTQGLQTYFRIQTGLAAWHEFAAQLDKETYHRLLASFQQVQDTEARNYLAMASLVGIFTWDEDATNPPRLQLNLLDQSCVKITQQAVMIADATRLSHTMLIHTTMIGDFTIPSTEDLQGVGSVQEPSL